MPICAGLCPQHLSDSEAMLFCEAPSAVEHSGPFSEISHRFVLLCGVEEVNGSESTPVEKESTMDP